MKQLHPVSMQNGLSQSGSYVLMLLEPQSRRQMPVIIGAAEAQAILIAKHEVKTRRPMTHELMHNMMMSFGLELQQIVIERVNEGIFYSTLHVSDGFNTRTLDSRTSDAIALALHCGAPIMVEDSVLDETAVAAPDANQAPTIEQLEQELRRCEENEEYERAAELQRQIEQLRQNKAQ